MVATVQTPRLPASIAERFFQGSLYLMLVMGFASLAGTGRLDAPSFALVAGALLLRGYHLFQGKNVSIPDRWTSLLTLLYLLFYAVDYFLLSQSFVAATVHMVLFIMVVKIFSVQRDRDLLYLAVLAFLMVLAAAVLTVDTVFLFTFCLFMLAAMCTFVSMEMRRSEHEARIITVVPANENKFKRSLYTVAGALAVSTVLVGVVIFFILPRMTLGGYLQSLGSQTDFVSGFSENVSLGGIGRIQQSKAPVMFVQLLNGGTLPPDIKWRGVALANFDGRRWSKPSHEATLIRPMNNLPVELRTLPISNTSVYSIPRRPTLQYRVIMEPIGSDIFFLASTPLRVNGPYSQVSISLGGSVSNDDPIRTIDVYEGEADTTDPAPIVQNSISQSYPPEVRTNYLGLPSQLDPRIPSLAKTVTASFRSNYARVNAIENYLRQNLGYTLALPGNEVDPLAHFLFERKRGHCEYFASSMAIMLRTLGIPARVVNGFRGGEYNDLSRTYIIRGRDAHSWVEAFFPEYGWVTFDPTPVAPTQSGSDATTRMALYLDALHEMWREWIVNYDFTRQARLGSEISSGANHLQGSVHAWYLRKYRRILRRVQNITGALSPNNIFLVAFLALAIMVLPFAPRAWRAFQQARLRKNPKAAPSTSATLWYVRMLKAMERRGIRKIPAQTPAEFISTIGDPEMQKCVMAFTQHYERARFAGSAEDAIRLPELYHQLAARKT